jgi:DNA polymerase III delta prime subunit
MTKIDAIMTTMSLNVSGLHYFILDEVDNLTKQAQQSLKSALNTTRGVFILTTNNVSQLDKGMLDRCILVEMNAANPNAYLDIAKSIADESGISLSSDELLPTIQGANGSFRNLFHNVGRLARRKAEKVPPNAIY